MGTETLGVEERTGRPRYARTGLLGLYLITATMALFGVIVLLQMPEEAGFVLPLVAVAAVTTFLVWRFEATWAHVLGAVIAVAAALMLFWVAFGLAHPSSLFDFVPAVMFVIGVPLALGGNIAAIVQRRRGVIETGTSRPERRLAVVTLGIVAVALVGSAVLAALARSTVDEALAADATRVDMTGFEFEPGAIEVGAGESLLVHNADPFMHDFVVTELGIEEVVTPGSDVLIEVPDAPGSYVVYCTLHSDTSDPQPDPED
jgi:plastocyanin